MFMAGLFLFLFKCLDVSGAVVCRRRFLLLCNGAEGVAGREREGFLGSVEGTVVSGILRVNGPMVPTGTTNAEF